ncbi:MAG: type II toxin-antitoxin system RelE/ParE family toxin [Candidatus Hydrogenedentes bacterium]|nr:type II toxin-antitoxin system RelE/ParE family toxin [Candidatus Hydrogenedentota bacterium]
MVEIRWTIQAIEDLEAIVEFIASDSPHYASLFAIDVLAAVKRLADFPNSGKHLKEIENPSIREVLFGTYRVIYRVKPELVEILTVYHGARLLDPTRIE